MGSKILLPALSPTMEVGKIAKWFVKEGDTVASGDILAEIETDKAIMEFEAISDGVVEKLLVAENDEPIPVNSPIAIVSGDDDTLGEEETSSDENAPVGLEETTTVSAATEAPREK